MPRVIAALAAIIIIPAIIFTTIVKDADQKVRIADRQYALEHASTLDERVMGLSGRDSLGIEAGMLFIFPENGLHSIWMKDMRFSLDIIWLNAEGRVTHIVQDVSPDTYPTSFKPSEPSRYVIELNAGEVAQNNLLVGDTVQLSL